MGLYRKKPVVIEAIQYNNVNYKEICEYTKEMAQPENIADVEAPKNWNETL